MEIFKLFGSIFVNTDDADKSMQKTEKNAESIAGKLGKGIKTAAKWGSGIATAATVVTGAFTGLATDAAGTADEIDKMSQKIGLSTKGYQEWAYIMGQNGMEIGKMQTGMKTLVAQMDAAAGGTASAVENFNKLGISIYDSNGKLKDQESIMEEALYALAEMKNGTEKARLATELFGKSGSEMMPMLNQGAQAMTDLKNRANDLGLVLSDDAVKNGVVFGDLMDDIKQSTSMLATSLGTTLFPILIQICEAILGNMPMIQEVFSSLAPIVMQFMTALLPALMELAQAIFPILIELINQLMPFISQIAQSILPIIVQLLQMFLPPMIQIAQAILPVIGEILTALMPLLGALLPVLKPILDIVVMLIQPIAELISAILPPLIKLLTQMLETVLPILSEKVEALANILSKTLADALQALQPITENVIGIFNGLVNFITGVFTGNWELAWNGIKEIFNGIINMIINITSAFISLIINSFNTFLNLIKMNWEKVWGGAKSFFFDTLNNIKTTTTNIFNAIKNTIINTIEGARDKVKAAIDKIRSFFNFSWELPKLKLPHFKIKGEFSLNPPSVPSFGIDWYKKAMNKPVIMDKPTAFGINNLGQVMAGGEAGSEVVSGTDTLMSMISSAVANQNERMHEFMQTIIDILLQYMPELANMQLITDTGVLVGEIAPQIDTELGKIAKRKDRG